MIITIATILLATPKNTALLLFTRSPQEELMHKNVLGQFQQKKQKQYYRLLVQHALQLGRKTGFPFYVVDSACQQGNTFGERLQQAFATYFERGFIKVIAIGNDCVQLKPADIIEAAAQLQNKQAVFGPARDGGVYLLGLDQNVFAQQTGFTQINWQTATVLSELQSWCSGYNHVTLSPIYSDLDTDKDIANAFNQKQLPHLLLIFINRLFSVIQHRVIQFSNLVINQFIATPSFRGPPVI